MRSLGPDNPPREVFVGRQEELTRLRRALDEVTAGGGRLVLLAGEPGMGKTRTVGEFVAAARAQGACVVVGHCREGEGTPPLWPWLQVVRECWQGAAAPALRDFDPLGVAVLAALVPEVACGVAGIPALPPLDPGAARFRSFDAVVRMLQHVCRRTPLVLALEDLHWSDAASLLLLQLAAQQCAAAPLMILATYRDADLRGSEGPRKLIHDLEHLPVRRGRAVLSRCGASARHAGAALAPRALRAVDRAWRGRVSVG
jgi:predicted ATPase